MGRKEALSSERGLEVRVSWGPTPMATVAPPGTTTRARAEVDSARLLAIRDGLHGKARAFQDAAQHEPLRLLVIDDQQSSTLAQLSFSVPGRGSARRTRVPSPASLSSATRPP